MMKHDHRKSPRTAKETAKLRADRERYQREKPGPEQLLAEGGHKEFVPLAQTSIDLLYGKSSLQLHREQGLGHAR